MQNLSSCACGDKPRLVFACSGAADVGAVADLAARRLTAEGKASMFCLAGVGGQVPGILKTVAGAGCLTAIDGCALDCAKKTLEKAGFTEVKHLRLTDMGLEKGRTPATEDHVSAVAQAAAAMLAGDRR
jgi:uncharacterized metal-binding protein